MIETRLWLKAGTIPWYKKINPLWWFGNEEGLDPNYQLSWPMWKRRLFWFFRNFMFNFFRYVVGTEDQDIVVTGPAPVFTPVWAEASPPSTGFKWAIIRAAAFTVIPLWLPFISYTGRHAWCFGKRVLWYAGWVPSGGRLGLKFNRIA